MNKAIIGLGVFALILGILLVSLPFVYVPHHVSEAYQIPESQWVTGEWLWFPPVPTNSLAAGEYLNANESLNIQVNATSGKNIDFFVNDGSTTILSYSNVTTLNKDWIVPQNSTYNFVFNSSSSFTDQDVSWQVTKQWNETDYRIVTQNTPLLPIQALYIGLGIFLLGLAIAVIGVNIKKKEAGLAMTFAQANAYRKSLFFRLKKMAVLPISLKLLVAFFLVSKLPLWKLRFLVNT
jgi:hypothetical protein